MLSQTNKITYEIAAFKNIRLSNYIKMPRLSQEVRNQAIGMIRAGTTMRDVARLSNVNKTAQLHNLGIPVLPWPAKSPDMNPIEHLWDELERRLRDRPNRPQNLRELRFALTEQWLALPRERVRRLILSMRRRCMALVNSRGGHTKY